MFFLESLNPNSHSPLLPTETRKQYTGMEIVKQNVSQMINNVVRNSAF